MTKIADHTLVTIEPGFSVPVYDEAAPTANKRVALNTAAGRPLTDFATAAQGAKADTALQDSDFGALSTGDDASDVPVITYGNDIDGTVQASLEAIDDTIAALPDAVYGSGEIDAAVHVPAAQGWHQYSAAGGTLVVYGATWVADGQGVAQKVSGSGDIVLVADPGFTINGATGIGTSTEVTDAVFGSSSGADTIITSAGTNLPDLAAGDFFRVPSHTGVPGNAGWYVATGSPGTGSLPCTKLANIGGGTLVNPVDDATAETIDIDEPARDGDGEYLRLTGLAGIKRVTTDFVVQGDVSTANDFGGVDVTGVKHLTLTGEVRGNRVPCVTRGAGSSQPTAADSGAFITTDGALTVPNLLGWNCTLRLGGDHDLTHNAITLDISAAPAEWGTGDIVHVLVPAADEIIITPAIAADEIIDEGDFS